MRKRNSFTNKSRRRQFLLALTVTVVVISAMIFVACKGRYIFIVPGMGFLLFAVTAVVFLSRACCELISRRWPKTIGFMRCAKIVRSYAGRGHAVAGNFTQQASPEMRQQADDDEIEFYKIGT